MVHLSILPCRALLRNRREGDLEVFGRLPLRDGPACLQIEVLLGDFLAGLGVGGDEGGAAVSVCIKTPAPEHANRAPGKKATSEDSDKNDSYQGPPEHLDDLEDRRGLVRHIVLIVRGVPRPSLRKGDHRHHHQNFHKNSHGVSFYVKDERGVDRWKSGDRMIIQVRFSGLVRIRKLSPKASDNIRCLAGRLNGVGQIIVEGNSFVSGAAVFWRIRNGKIVLVFVIVFLHVEILS